MINAIYGKKIGMTQIFDEDDRIVPVTVIQAEPNTVCQVKTVDTDGYEAVQMGFGYIKPRRVNRPMQGHFDKQGAEPKRYLREVRVENAGEYKVGDTQTVAAFAEVKKVDVKNARDNSVSHHWPAQSQFLGNSYICCFQTSGGPDLARGKNCSLKSVQDQLQA